ncbi:hypothetical protein BDV95DRAFT_8175 [Massariosphaeria phaeospora]|uniref:Uncharacterized protein n=1 Tax=Massariosphaeria phaeospora TaxID=100035 RepID=A0A7C8MI06_9PLEO|nr:hypothetical protein BDV95DRAFT_8175 [Massariosphaeria phaeospora]
MGRRRIMPGNPYYTGYSKKYADTKPRREELLDEAFLRLRGRADEVCAFVKLLGWRSQDWLNMSQGHSLVHGAFWLDEASRRHRCCHLARWQCWRSSFRLHRGRQRRLNIPPPDGGHEPFTVFDRHIYEQSRSAVSWSAAFTYQTFTATHA